MPTKATTKATGAATGARAAYWTPERRAQAAEAGRKGAAVAKEKRTLHVVSDDDTPRHPQADDPVNGADQQVLTGGEPPAMKRAANVTPKTPKTPKKAAPADGIRVRQHRGGGHKSQYLATAEKDGKTMYRYGPTEDEARARMREALGG